MTQVLPSRLIVDLPNWVGDQVMAMPAIRRLVDGNAGGATTLHARPEAGRFFAEFFPETSVVASPPKAWPVLTARQLCGGAGRFDVGVTLRHASRAKICLWLAARRSMGSANRGGRFLLSDRVEVDRLRHQVFDADPILERLGLEGVDPGWRPAMPLALVEEGARRLLDAGVRMEGAVGLAPAAVWGRSKMWPASSFGELARRLRTRGLEVVVVIGPGEEAIGRAVGEASSDRLPVVGSNTDVAGLAGVVSQLSLLVGNDSGPMHVAATVGVPAVALFGPTDPERTRPLGDRHVVLRRQLDCAPCGHRRCPFGHTACLHELPVDTVERSVLDLLH
jgi:heptosyltransferase-2